MGLYFVIGLIYSLAVIVASNPHYADSSAERKLIYKTRSSSGPTPIVLWHGMGDSCCNPLSMGYVKKLLKTHIPGVYVKSLMIGNNVIEDTEHGFFANMNEHVAKVCQQIAQDDALQNGYNAIGFSQGGLFVRALAQRCPHPPMRTLISVGGPQQGIYGLPHCLGTVGLCNAARHLLNYGAYSSIVQKMLVQAQYWHDPYVSEGYANRSIFLSDLNCEKGSIECNSTYKDNLSKLKHLVLVKFLKDEMIVPKESEWFGYYPDNTSSSTVQMEDTPLFHKDLIGLKTLSDSNRLHLLAIDGQHLQIPNDVFEKEIIDKYLKKPSVVE
ncbi:palmitoyl protein thioesterase domain-containing protein [Ditylenchus destructor]|nr:palmitoyl protein thioesterase domain-containing protein [Ditylenchus destructor]